MSKFPPLFPYWDANPLGAPGPYPAGTKIPIQTLNYETHLDLIAESNLAYPLINRNPSAGLTWRDLNCDIMLMSWNYQDQAAIELPSSYGFDVIMRFENDKPANGSVAIATFYGVSDVE